MRGNDNLGDFIASLRLRFWRQRQFDILLADPRRRAVHDRLRDLKTQHLIRTPVVRTRFVVIDTETTGLQAYAGDEMVSISLIELQGLEPTGREFNTFINPQRPIPPASTAIHQITDADVADAPVIADVLPDVVRFIGTSVVVGHHVPFDIRFLNKTLQQQFLCRLQHPWLDTMMLYLAVSGRWGHYTLEEVAALCHVDIRGRHTARGDARITADVFKTLIPRLTSGVHPVSRVIKRQTAVGHV